MTQHVEDQGHEYEHDAEYDADRHCLTDKVHPGYQARVETGRLVGSPALEPPTAATGIARRRSITRLTVIEPNRGRSTR